MRVPLPHKDSHCRRRCYWSLFPSPLPPNPPCYFQRYWIPKVLYLLAIALCMAQFQKSLSIWKSDFFFAAQRRVWLIWQRLLSSTSDVTADPIVRSPILDESKFLSPSCLGSFVAHQISFVTPTQHRITSVSGRIVFAFRGEKRTLVRMCSRASEMKAACVGSPLAFFCVLLSSRMSGCRRERKGTTCATGVRQL